EVVERMVAEPGSKAFGRLSIMLQVRYHMEHVLDVPPASFNPPPKVDSAVVRLTPLPPEQRHDADPALVERIVRHAFGQRRKTLSNALSGVATAAQIDAAGIDPRVRAEQLAPLRFVDLAKVVAHDAM
ncbi:MAG TPA: rRNA adenine dimethyltransferase family protein, partial [Tahibacter sp.]|nr:rRNA adenine dimethyltransferase family protein [Tahibacter sp.]